MGLAIARAQLLAEHDLDCTNLKVKSPIQKVKFLYINLFFEWDSPRCVEMYAKQEFCSNIFDSKE